jgi:iron complex transport system substrate-binding protein
LALVALLMGACSSPQDGSLARADVGASSPPSLVLPSAVANPRSLTGPRTAVITDRSIGHVSARANQDLPATVTSYDRGGDQEVTVTDTSRIVAMNVSGSIAQTIAALGFAEHIVGRDAAAAFPGDDDVPVITKDGHSINQEAILDLQPTLVITDGSIGPVDVVTQLRDVGVPVVFVQRDPSFAGAGRLAAQVAEALGVPDEGKRLADEIEQQISAVRSQVASLVPRDPADRIRMLFLYIRGTAGIYYLFGDGTGAGDLIDALGGIDVVDENGWGELTPLTDEAMVEADPDLILVMTDGLASAGGIDGLLESRPAVALTTAGQNRRIIDMADRDVLSFGPQSAAVLAALAAAVYSPGAQQ